MAVKQITPKEAFDLLKKDKNSALVDVRTFEEFNLVGLADPDHFDDRMVLLPWLLFPEMSSNHEFDANLENSLKKIFGNAIEEVQIIFTCKTGGRSNEAANYALNLGYKNCYNLTSGFEGDLNQFSQRGKINGWKAENLPWRQN